MGKDKAMRLEKKAHYCQFSFTVWIENKCVFSYVWMRVIIIMIIYGVL